MSKRNADTTEPVMMIRRDVLDTEFRRLISDGGSSLTACLAG
jgi:hypothetical protein